MFALQEWSALSGPLSDTTGQPLGHLNVGTGVDLSIRQLANQVAQVVGYKGKIDWDMNMPDGTPKKQLDVSRLRMMGWKASTPLEEGLTLAYQNFQDAIAGECLGR